MMKSLLVCALLAITQAALSAQIDNLYQGEVAVADQSEAVRQQALEPILSEVLLRLLGQRPTANRPAARQIAANAKSYLDRYQYTTVRLPSADGSSAPVEQLRLRASFDKLALDQALRSAGLPVWGRTRPSVLVWMAVEQEGQRRLLGQGDGSGLTPALERQAQRRGIPLVTPLMDLEDTARLTITDLDGGNADAILSASERYRVESVVTARIQEVSPQLWQARWTLFANGRQTSWNSQGAGALLAIEEGFDGAADRIAGIYAQPINLAGQGQVLLHISGIDEVSAYARVVAYLNSLDSVSRVELTQAAGSEMSFRIENRGGEQALARVIALGRVLRPGGSASSGLSYLLLP